MKVAKLPCEVVRVVGSILELSSMDVPKNAATATLYTYTPWVGESGGGKAGVGGTSLYFRVLERFADALANQGQNDAGPAPSPRDATRRPKPHRSLRRLRLRSGTLAPAAAPRRLPLLLKAQGWRSPPWARWSWPRAEGASPEPLVPFLVGTNPRECARRDRPGRLASGYLWASPPRGTWFDLQGEGHEATALLKTGEGSITGRRARRGNALTAAQRDDPAGLS